MRKYWAVHCDVTGCQARTAATKASKRATRDLARALGWQVYIDARKKDRERCPTHRKDLA